MQMLKALAIAKEEVGYLEKETNARLDDKLANAGDKNFTKYARDLDAIPGFFSGKKQGFAWCSTFVSWCFTKAYGAELAKRMTYQPEKSLAAGVKYAADYYKAAGRYFQSNPLIGDQIFFGKKGLYTHTGIVEQVGSSYVYTIEGNTSGASGVIENGGGVCRKSYKIDSEYIFGYGRPDYTLVEDDYDVTMHKLEKGSKGAQVKTAQALLIKKFGISCGIYGADGDFGNATIKAVVKFQTQQGLTPDGIVGDETWMKLLH